MKTALTPVIAVDSEKCVNCHACISACPVKFCNDGSGDHVAINHDMCLGCGTCIDACRHGARLPMDDFSRFMRDLQTGVPMVAVVAPAVATSFPEQYLEFNGWLKSLGVKAIFDVCFGAELTVVTYLEHLRENKPPIVIAQPCPALVTYMQVYKPELLPYLAPADSPMAHSMKMIRAYYPEYARCRIAVMSPCLAKRREFDAIGLGDYNVTFRAVSEYLQARGQRLGAYPKVEFDGGDPERAVLFSTPGGLMRTAARWNESIRDATRKIEGPGIIYEYLHHLPQQIANGNAPVLLDCLNCEMGCNGGPGTLNRRKPLDEIEHLIEKRSAEMKKLYARRGVGGKRFVAKRVERELRKYWKAGLYGRTYENLAGNRQEREPSDADITRIYRLMHKTNRKDELDCSACGYGQCREMAKAIHNGLNKPENCHHYQSLRLKQYDQRNKELADSILSRMNTILRHQDTLRGTFQGMQEQLHDASEKSNGFGPIVTVIKDLAKRINLLALNASIEAAHAGEYGMGFNVVAGEVKGLAIAARSEVEKIEPCVEQLRAVFDEMLAFFSQLEQQFGEVAALNEDVTSASREILEGGDVSEMATAG